MCWSSDHISFDKPEKAGIKADLIKQMEKQKMTDFLNGFRLDKRSIVNAKIGNEEYKISAKISLQSKVDGPVNINPIQRVNVRDEYMGNSPPVNLKATRT